MVHPLAEKNSNLHLLELDVRDVSTQRLPEMVEKVEAVLAGSGLNLLINNAGIATNETSWHDVTVDAMKSSYEVNTIAPLMITKAFLPLLKRAGLVKEPSSQPQAAVVNISTIMMASIQLHQSQGVKMKLPYRTTKAALNMVTKSLSLDLIKDGIIVVSIHPGWVKTDMGTQKASLTTSESVASMLNVIGSLDITKNGCFLNYDGTTLPW